MFDEIKEILRENLGSSDYASEYLSMPSLKVSQVIREELSIFAEITETHKMYSSVIPKSEVIDLIIKMVSETEVSADCFLKKKAMKEIYKTFLSCQNSSDFEICDIILSNVDIEHCNPSVLLSFLMASYSMKNKLSYRPLFYEKVYNLFRLMYGLEEANSLILKLR